MTRQTNLRTHIFAGAAIALALAGGLTACSSDDTADKGKDDKKTQSPEGKGSYQASISRTADGVPHISGKTFGDVVFGQGYASGQDRTCDLADQVIKIRGERAKYLGAGDEDANLNSDIQWRTIGIFDSATKDWEKIPAEVQDMFKAFTAGWNSHLEEVGVDKISGWCAAEKWVRPLEPSETYAYARSIALSASGARIGAYIPTAQPPSAESAEPAGAASPGSPGVGAAGAPQPTEAPSGKVGGDVVTSADPEAPMASNGWAIGSERSETKGGMLLANPHFPWEGELRFWESQLTVTGDDPSSIYGVQLSGIPGIGIGFTENFGWTHTVSAGNRFTAYTLDLVEGDPTSYVYGDEEKKMTSKDLKIEVLGSDGKTKTVNHTAWYSHYGPIIDFPGFGWSDKATISYRDANIDNNEFIEQYYAVAKAKNLDEFKKLHEEFNGVPLFNTIATSADGEAWYADTSATPNLSEGALADYETALEANPIVKIAADNGAILLNGSDPVNEWVDEQGARDPGLVPYKEQPQVSRDDYVFNANDSFWMAHATEFLTGDYSPLHGRQETARSPRTRENATVLDDTTASGASGEDGVFSLDELADASLDNVGYTARELREAVVERCGSTAEVTVPPFESEDEEVDGLPGATVDISQACKILADWDGVYDLDSKGAALWREFMSRFEYSDLLDAGVLWATPFDPTKPLSTPNGLAPVVAGGQADLILENLARAVQALDAAGFDPDVALGEIQFSLRNGERIPIHGGGTFDGTTNIVSSSKSWSIRDPKLVESKREPITNHSPLMRVDGESGYPITYGTSFLMALAYGENGPQAKVFLTYGNTEDRNSELYTAVTERFSKKNWRTVAFTPDAVKKDATNTITVKG